MAKAITKLISMNKESILGIVRHILTTVGGGLVTTGTINSEQLQTGAGAVVVIIGVVWSIVEKRARAK